MKESNRSPYINYALLKRRIQQYRKARSMTQLDLALALGYSTESNYGKLERGDRPINLKRLAEICLILKVPLEDMLAGCLIHDKWAESDAIVLTEETPNGECFNALLKGQSQRTINLAFAVCKSIVDEMNKKGY